MPSIGDMQYGYSKEGLNSYLEEIKGIVLSQASEALNDISSITTVCQNEWEGKARDNFIDNLKKDAKKVSSELKTLYNILESEIEAVQAAMASKDKDLINF